jgi:Mg2+-importing ATPase
VSAFYAPTWSPNGKVVACPEGVVNKSEHYHNLFGVRVAGINDAPALKAAHVGLVVREATDVARDAADIILLQKSLHVIVEGIGEGRVIFTNISKYIKATLTSNFGNFYTLAIASLLVSYLPILPLQILLINLLTDFPMIAVATDTVEPEETAHPKTYDFKDTILLGTVLGFVSTIFDFIFFVMFAHISASTLQTNWFIGSVLTELVLLFSIRTHRFVLRAARPATWLMVFSGVAALTAIAMPFTGLGHTLFSFITPSMGSMRIIFFIVAAYFVTTELCKQLFYRTVQQPKNGGP